MPRSASVWNILAAMPALERMPTPTALILAVCMLVRMSLKPTSSWTFFSSATAWASEAFGHGEGEVALVARAAHRLDDHVDVDVGFGQRAEHRRDHARPVGQVDQRDQRLVAVVGDAGDDVAFHVAFLDFVVADDHRARLVLERRTARVRGML